MSRKSSKAYKIMVIISELMALAGELGKIPKNYRVRDRIFRELLDTGVVNKCHHKYMASTA